jgi:hypothetical protein
LAIDYYHGFVVTDPTAHSVNEVAAVGTESQVNLQGVKTFACLAVHNHAPQRPRGPPVEKLLAVASGGSNLVTILLGNGDGTFQPRGVRFGTGLLPQGLAVGDFNENGRLDLAVPARLADVVSIMVQ